MSWAHVPPPERCSCCALPDVPEPYLQNLEWDTHVRDWMASRAGLLEHTLSLDGWATIDATHVRKWFRPFCFCFSDSRYKRLAPACIHNDGSHPACVQKGTPGQNLRCLYRRRHRHQQLHQNTLACSSTMPTR